MGHQIGYANRMIHILLSITFELLRRRKITAEELAQKYNISPRTVYRYVRRLAPFLPLHIQRGRAGGICLSDSFKLPAGFLSDGEYEAAVKALTLAYSASPKEEFLAAKRKLTSVQKQARTTQAAWLSLGELLLLPSSNESERCRTEREILRLLQTGIAEKRRVRLLYGKIFPPSASDGATPSLPLEYAVEPHFLTLQGTSWSLCGFCLTRREFMLFPVAQIHGVLLTEDSFRPRNLDIDEFLKAVNVLC